MDPPIQAEYVPHEVRATLSWNRLCFRTAENKYTRVGVTFMSGKRAVSSFHIRSAIPGNKVLPPDMTTFAQRSLRISISHFMIELKLRDKLVSAGKAKERRTHAVLWMPRASGPSMPGWKRTSGVQKLGRIISLTPATVFRERSPFAVNRDDPSIRELVAVLDGKRTRSGTELFLEVVRDVAQLLYIPDHLSLVGGLE